MKWLILPFARKKKPQEGPTYGDLYERGLAAAIDLMLAFLLLDNLFRRITAALYAGVDRNKLALVNHETDLVAILKHLWQLHVIQLYLINFSVQILIIGVFFVGAQWFYGTTPGKWLLGLKVANAKTLEPPSKLQYLIRFFAYIPACAPLMLGILWVSFNRRRRGWHDYMAGTVVLSLRPRGWYYHQAKRGIKKLFGKKPSTALVPLEEPVGEPAAEQRHEDGTDPIR